MLTKFKYYLSRTGIIGCSQGGADNGSILKRDNLESMGRTLAHIHPPLLTKDRNERNVPIDWMGNKGKLWPQVASKTQLYLMHKKMLH